MPKNNFVTELVNAFNLFNYYFDDFNTNFTVKGNKIVGLFAYDVEMKKYFQEIKKEIIKLHCGTEEAAGRLYNLNYFPFAFDVNSKRKAKERAIEVELADSTNNEVIRNLKIYFAKGFQYVVEAKVIKNLEINARMIEKKACECLEGSVLEEIDRYSPYLYCISFNDRYFKERGYPPRFFEVFRDMYISAFDLKLEEYGFNDSSIFYEQRDNKLYIKDITNINVVKNVAKHVKGRVALDFRTPGKEDSKVENFKDVLSSLMPKRVRESISAYDYDIFTDKKKIQNGDSFVLIPLIEMDDGQFETLSFRDASKINRVFNNSISDIKGKTANPQYVNCKEPVYAFSNQQIALLLPKIMESPITYNEISGSFEFAVDLENFKRRSSSRFSSTATSPTHTNSARSSQPQSPSNSPTHAGPSGLKTPPNQRKRNSDSGYDSNSPSKSSGDPGPSTKVSHSQVMPPRQARHHVGAAQNVPAGTSAWAQQTSHGLSPASSAGLSLRQPSRPLSWQGTNPVETNLWQFTKPGPNGLSWQQSEASSLRGANPLPQQIRARTLPTSNAELRQQSQVSSSGPLSCVGNHLAQQTSPWLSQGTSENKRISSMQFTKPGSNGLSWPQSGASSSRGANESGSAGTNTCTQNPCSSSKGADKSVRTTWYMSPPLTTGDDSMPSSSRVCVDSPSVKGSDRKSSDKCSEAKPQESKPLKEHGGGLFCKERRSKLAKSPTLSRDNEGRTSVCSMSSMSSMSSVSSSRSAPEGFIAGGLHRIKQFASDRRAKSHPPSKVTSPNVEKHLQEEKEVFV